MKLVKEFRGVDLVISEVLRGTIWNSPTTLIDERGEYISLSKTAANQVAKKASLKDYKSADSLFMNNPIKWAMFVDVFNSAIPDSEENMCFTNKNQTIIYSFIQNGLSDETDELEKTYNNFFESNLETNTLEFNDEAVFLTIKNLKENNFMAKVFTLFFPENPRILSFAMKISSDNDVYLLKIFDNTLVGKKHTFVFEDLDISIHLYDLDMGNDSTHETDADFYLSLREVINTLRIAQNTKHLAVDNASFSAIFIEMNGGVEADLTKEIDNFYSKLNEYFFYFNEEPVTVDDISLIHDKLKSPKGSLYFCKKLRYLDVKSLLSKIITSEVTLLENSEKQDVYYLLNNVAHLMYLQSKQDFDYYTIRNRWE